MTVWQYGKSGNKWEFMFKILSEEGLTEFKRNGVVYKNPAACCSEKVIYELLD